MAASELVRHPNRRLLSLRCGGDGIRRLGTPAQSDLGGERLAVVIPAAGPAMAVEVLPGLWSRGPDHRQHGRQWRGMAHGYTPADAEYYRSAHRSISAATEIHTSSSLVRRQAFGLVSDDLNSR